jgi:hypothetical protein
MDNDPIDELDLPAIDALVTCLVHTRRAIASLQAFEATVMSAAVDVVAARTSATPAGDQATPSVDQKDLPWREVSAEIAAALHMSDRTVQGRLGEAAMLVGRFPATHAAWAAGELDQSRVRVIIDAGCDLPTPDARAAYEARVLPHAADLTPGRLTPVCRTVARELDPESITQRHARARKVRGVRTVDLDDGMSRLLLDGPATLIHAIFDRVTQMARTVQKSAGTRPADRPPVNGHLVGVGVHYGPEADAARAAERKDTPPAPAATDVIDGAAADERTLDQVRADVLTDMLLTAVPDGHGPADVLEKIAAHVQVSIPAPVLHPDPARRSTDLPAELVGYGPIDDDTARLLAGAAKGWDRLIADPFTGAPLQVDRYQPSEHLHRVLRIRDEHCRFPGCRQPVWRCDLDHTRDAALGGPTQDDNLENLCRGHHVVKHQTRWRVRQLAGGVLEWTSPTGRIYEDHPSPQVRFVCTDPPPF